MEHGPPVSSSFGPPAEKVWPHLIYVKTARCLQFQELVSYISLINTTGVIFYNIFDWNSVDHEAIGLFSSTEQSIQVSNFNICRFPTGLHINSDPRPLPFPLLCRWKATVGILLSGIPRVQNRKEGKPNCKGNTISR